MGLVNLGPFCRGEHCSGKHVAMDPTGHRGLGLWWSLHSTSQLSGMQADAD